MALNSILGSSLHSLQVQLKAQPGFRRVCTVDGRAWVAIVSLDQRQLFNWLLGLEGELKTSFLWIVHFSEGFFVLVSNGVLLLAERRIGLDGWRAVDNCPWKKGLFLEHFKMKESNSTTTPWPPPPQHTFPGGKKTHLRSANYAVGYLKLIPSFSLPFFFLKIFLGKYQIYSLLSGFLLRP